MQTSNCIQISGSFNRIFDLAADIARWPEILPHYRWVKILEKRDGEVEAEMAARHKGVPLWWRTIQRPIKEQKRIEFSHIGGITRGMQVQWTFTPVQNDGTEWLVEIHHQFHPPWPPPGPWFAKRVIGEMFVKQVANKTLAKIKEIIES